MRSVKVLGVAVAVAAASLLAGGSASADLPAAPATSAAAVPVAPAEPAPAPASPAAPAIVTGTPCLSSARACVELRTNRAWLISNGAVVYGPVQITHGRKGYATPPGTFRVSFKDINHASSLFESAPMPYSVFFNGGIAFHQGSLRLKSHGCIHLSRAAARTFYNSLARGDVVQVVA